MSLPDLEVEDLHTLEKVRQYRVFEAYARLFEMERQAQARLQEGERARAREAGSDPARRLKCGKTRAISEECAATGAAGTKPALTEDR